MDTTHRLLTAILLAHGTPIPEAYATDTQGKELTINGVIVQLEESDSATDRVNELHPPPPGTYWAGFWSTQLIPSSGAPESSIDFNIIFIVLGDTDETLQKVIWLSNDSDIRNGDIVFGTGDVAQRAPSSIFQDGFESGDAINWTNSVSSDPRQPGKAH